jgi:hypothetical protein
MPPLESAGWFLNGEFHVPDESRMTELALRGSERTDTRMPSRRRVPFQPIRA